MNNAILKALSYTGDNDTLKAAYDDYLDFLFMDWFNNFLTLDRYADYYGLEKDQAHAVIEAGRKIHDDRAVTLQNLS